MSSEDDLRIREAGIRSEGQPTVLIVTGAGDPTVSWLPAIDRIAEFAHVVAFDRPGIGDSPDRRHHKRSLDTYLEEIESVLEAVEVERCVLVGHSLGGLLSRVFLKRHPERVAGMVLVDTSPQHIAEDRVVRFGFAASAAIAAVLRSLAPLGVLRLLVALKSLPLYPEQRIFAELAPREVYADWRRTVRADFRRGLIGELKSVIPTTRAALAELNRPPATLSLPVELIGSRAYGRQWVTMHQSLRARYPEANAHSTSDRFHNVHMVHPGSIAEAVRAVLRRASEGG